MFRKMWLVLPWIFLAALTTFASSERLIESRSIQNEYFIIIDENPTLIGTSNYFRNIADMRDLEYGIMDAGGTVLNKYFLVFTGIHARLSAESLAQIETIAFVQKIQPNQVAYLIDAEQEEISAVASWGLDRIDQRSLPLSNTYKAPEGPTTVHAYIVDSGIRSSHVEFTGRIGNGFSTISDPSLEDCLGHGTHVSGTVMGSTAGVFQKTVVHPVRVFGCSGSTTFDAILKGLEWIIANGQKPAVANMSLGANTSVDLLDVAVRNTVAAGVTVVVAAGNSSLDACQSTPAREPTAITVAASDINDKRAYFSNFGSCVDLFAPGVSIVSSYHTGDNAYASLSGTSMASPHTCGAAAAVASLYPTWTPKQISDELVKQATPDKIVDPQGSPNKLLYVEFKADQLIVDAGPDVIKIIPDNDVLLVGKAKSGNGTIIEAKWRQMSGPTAMSNWISGSDIDVSLLLRKLVAGKYVFRFTVTDSLGRTAYDDVNVTVNARNSPPVAEAGADSRINPQGSVGNDLVASLDGGGSTDPDNDIVSYRWDVVEGDASKLQIVDANSKSTQLTATASGKYVIRLTVTDSQGLSSSDTKIVAVNYVPTCDAGPDFEVAANAPSFTLNGTGSDLDNDPVYFLWWQLDGPNRVNLSNLYGNSTTVTGFVPGTYSFRFFIVDSLKALGWDDVFVKVK